MVSMLNQPSYNDRYRKIFSLPVKNGGSSILHPEDRANGYENSIRICEPLQNHNAIDAEIHPEKRTFTDNISFLLTKGKFSDAIALRYWCYSVKLPSTGTIGKRKNLMQCKNAGYMHRRHNCIRANLHNEVCDNVEA